MEEGEEWRHIPGYSNKYIVSNYGNIISYKGIEPKWMKPRMSAGKYLMVTLCEFGKWKHFSPHRLVWEAFNGPIPQGMEVNHKDLDKTNNRLDNLELLTHQQNLIHAFTEIKRRRQLAA